jgi:hypothetical protein
MAASRNAAREVEPGGEVIAFPNAVQAPVSIEPLLDALAQRIARLVAHLIPERERSPWMKKEEALPYSGLREGTFEKLAADGRIRSHGGKTKVFHREELDEDLRAL